MSCATRALSRKTSPERKAGSGPLRRAAVMDACQCAECAKGKGLLQRAAVHEHAPAEVPDIVYDVLRSPGAPLDRPTRQFMEQRFRHDFSAVRLHTDARAAESARAVQARAYTVGSHVIFGRGEHRPSTDTGKRLLAHELTHVIQQGSPSLSLSPAVLRFEQSRTFEEEASRAARTALQADAHPALRSVLSLQRRAFGLDENATESSAKKAENRLETEGIDSDGKKSATPVNIRTFFLTFDDGPDARETANRTAKVLDALGHSKYGSIKAAFFIQTGPKHGGTEVGRKLVDRMYREGHIVGIHTGGKQDHEPHPDAASAGRLESELKSAEAYLLKRIQEVETEKKVVVPVESIIDVDEGRPFVEPEPPKWVRPPYGVPFIKKMTEIKKTKRGKIKKERHFTKEDEKSVSRIYQNVGLTKMMWDIDGDGGGNLSRSSLLKRLSDELWRLRKGGWKTTTPSANIVVLYHDIQQGTADNIPAILEHIETETKRISGGKDRAEFTKP